MSATCSYNGQKGVLVPSDGLAFQKRISFCQRRCIISHPTRQVCMSGYLARRGKVELNEEAHFVCNTNKPSRKTICLGRQAGRIRDRTGLYWTELRRFGWRIFDAFAVARGFPIFRFLHLIPSVRGRTDALCYLARRSGSSSHGGMGMLRL